MSSRQPVKHPTKNTNLTSDRVSQAHFHFIGMMEIKDQVKQQNEEKSMTTFLVPSTSQWSRKAKVRGQDWS